MDRNIFRNDKIYAVWFTKNILWVLYIFSQKYNISYICITKRPFLGLNLEDNATWSGKTNKVEMNS